jgi:sigma-B regulation protein RsbU (phosphoserine phosphatase)
LHQAWGIRWPTVIRVRPDEERAGLRVGDRILAVLGRPRVGLSVLDQALAQAHPGQTIELRVRHRAGAGPGAEETLNVPVAADRSRGPVVENLVLGVMMPLLALGLGFWAAAVRVRDNRAWLFLALMLSLGGFGGSTVTSWSHFWRPVAVVYRRLSFVGWPIAMLLFGLYFPQPFAWERRRPYLKWLLLVPLSGLGLLSVLLYLGESEYTALADWALRLYRPFAFSYLYLMMTANALFFVALSVKWGRTTQPDARRRLRLLTLGTAASLVPLWLLILASLIRFGDDEFERWPTWVTAPAFAMMFLFPLTMAYVIVVERAMDVRVVLRQGMQYALARGGVRAFQIIVILAAIALAASLAAAPETGTALNTGAVVLAVTSVALAEKSAARLRAWVDRRFFRDAYDAEMILTELAEEVRTMVETAPLLSTVAERLSRALHVRQVALLLENGAAFEPAFALGYDATPPVCLPTTAIVVERVRKDGALQIYMDDADSWIHQLPPDHAAERTALDQLHAQLVLPLALKDKLIGLMSLGAKRSEEPFTGADLRLLRSVAAQTGLALEHSRLTAAIAQEVALRERHRRELEIAREVQEQLFPQRRPTVPCLDYYGTCRPARDVGGDSYDFLDLGDGRFGFAIADVSGKGIPAALLMAGLQASVRAQTLLRVSDLARLIANVNRLVYDASPSNRYVTFFYAQLDPATRTLSYVNAGHNAPMLFRDGEVLRLEAGGPVIGLLPEAAYQEASLALRSGDVIVAFTDGVSEAMNSADEEWGEERLMAAVRDRGVQPAADLAQHLQAAADAFAAGAPQHDDMTLVVLRVL